MHLFGMLSVQVFRIFSRGAGFPSKHFGVCAVSTSGSSPFVLLQSSHGEFAHASRCFARSIDQRAKQSELTLFLCDLQQGEFAREVVLDTNFASTSAVHIIICWHCPPGEWGVSYHKHTLACMSGPSCMAIWRKMLAQMYSSQCWWKGVQIFL